MKFSFWPFTRKPKRFDLEAALANAETLPPGQPLILEGHPTPAEVQALAQRVKQRQAAETLAAVAPATPTPKAPVPPRRPSPQKKPVRRSK